MKKITLALIFSAAVFTSAFAQPATPPVGPAEAVQAGPSEDEMRRINAGLTYLQQVDSEVRTAYEKYNRTVRESQLKIELAQAQLDEVIYGRMKNFDASVAKVADAKLAEAKTRRQAAEDELAKLAK